MAVGNFTRLVMLMFVCGQSLTYKCDVNYHWHGRFGADLRTCVVSNVVSTNDNLGFEEDSAPNTQVKYFKIVYEKGLKYLPINVAEKLPNLIAYRVSHCSVTEMKRTHFQGLHDLDFLNLTSNQISTIDPASFDDLKNLKFLALDHNKIKDISNLFSGLTSLNTLHLENNQIKVITSLMFKNLVNLEDLFLDNNRIASFPDNTFDELVMLKKLSFNNNQIRTINAVQFVNLHQIQKISMSDNQITRIESPEALKKLENLKYLNLNGNKLAEQVMKKQYSASNIDDLIISIKPKNSKRSPSKKD